MSCHLVGDMNTASKAAAETERMSRADRGEASEVMPLLWVEQEDSLSILWDALDEVTDDWADYFKEKRAMRAEDEATDEIEDENGYGNNIDVNPGQEAYFGF